MTELIHIKSSLANQGGKTGDITLAIVFYRKSKQILLASIDSVEDDQGPTQISSRTSSLSLPMALPLKRADRKPLRRYGEHYEEKGKESKISKIFQLAVTALSFLAFGGYLLTLIITAIRRNSMNTSTAGNVIVLSVSSSFAGTACAIAKSNARACVACVATAADDSELRHVPETRNYFDSEQRCVVDHPAARCCRTCRDCRATAGPRGTRWSSIPWRTTLR